MPTGDRQRSFAEAAARDGIHLVPAYREPWLNQQGHLGLPEELTEVRAALERIFVTLGGDLAAQAAKRTTSLTGDFLHPPSGTLIEVDEHQHFTSHRLQALDLYPETTALGFCIDDYRALCRSESARADRYRASKPAPAFGEGGRQRQRAYYDALRDLATPAMDRPPLIRVDAVQGDGTAVFEKARSGLAHLRG